MSEGTDIPGPIDWVTASHWIEYNHDNHTVETWCKMGPNYQYRVRTRVRPMSRLEILYSVTNLHFRKISGGLFGENNDQDQFGSH